MEPNERARAHGMTIPEEILAGMAAVGAGSGGAVLGDAGSVTNMLGAPLGAAIMLGAITGEGRRVVDNSEVLDA